MRWLRERISLRGEKGQSIVLVSAALPVLLAAAALVIDGSNLFVNKRALQNAADAAALAAAAELNNGTCAATCASAAGKYAGLNRSNPTAPSTSFTAMPACASASSRNCYAYPYKADPNRVEVRLTRSVPTLFGRIFGISHNVTVHAVGAITNGSPPELTFAALNNSLACEAHTLVIRSSGNLIVNNKIFVDTCNGQPGDNKGDGFDIFGPGGTISAKDILTHGGWETHDGDLVYIPVGNITACPLFTAKSNTPWQPGCPKTGQPVKGDPFPTLQPPALFSPISSNCTIANPC